MNVRMLRFKLIEKLWPYGGIGKKVARAPVLDKVLGPILWNEKNLDATYIPVGESVDVPPGSLLPFRVIEELVRKASRRFIMDRCICRSAGKCGSYPVEIGCLFLGGAAGDIEEELGRHASADEALDHVRRASAHGLLPCVLHASFDASLLGIDYRRMLAVCFCCNCCCVFRTDMLRGPVAYRDRIIRLPGLSMTSRADCAACRKCTEACFLGAVSLGKDGPEFADFCKGCGRCADACPRGNIRVELDPAVDTLGSLLERIDARTDIS